MNTTDRATVSKAAGYQVPEGSVLYRGYVITPDGHVYEWGYVHRNYAGPPDDRHGEEATIEAAKAAIDERIDSGFDDNPQPVGYAVRLGGAA